MNEIILKQWHDEKTVFHKEEKISFAQCTPDYKLSWGEILRFTSDMAGEDYSQRGMSWSFLQEKGIVFVVTRISFKVLKMPAANEVITLRTWETAPTGPFATRDYEISDKETGELLIKGLSLWTILDLKNNRLIPAKAYPYRPVPAEVSGYDGLKPGKISIPDNMVPLGTHTVLYSELDTNNHTNNSKYINFAIDYLPEAFRSKQIRNIRLNYSKETKLGDCIEIKGLFLEEENKYILQGISGSDSAFECELYF